MSNRVPRILIVEDNFLVAMDEQCMVERAGCTVAGPVGSVAEALEIIRRSRLEGAVLDVNLGDERVWPVTELLNEQGVPFVLATGYDVFEVPERFRERPVLTKPITFRDVEKALRDIGVL